MSMPHNRTGTGRFAPGVSGNPGGRPRGLLRAVRELVGEDGEAIAVFWSEVMNDQAAKVSDRLEASRLLAERGFGKTPMEIFEPVDGDERDERSTEVERWPNDERLLELARLAAQLGPAPPTALSEGAIP
jgi:hypothetical protein